MHRHIARGEFPRPWHVVHVIGHLRTGGAERQLVNYIEAADRTDFRHTVICLEQPGELAARVRAADVEVIHMPVRTRYIAAVARRYGQWFRQHRVAVVHAHMHHAALFGRLGGLWAGVPVMVTTEHGKELWKGSLQLGADRLLSRISARHICVSAENVLLRQKREKIVAEKLVVVPNGVPIPDLAGAAAARARVRRELGFTDDMRVLGTVGRLIEAKGYRHLAEALVGLAGRHPEVRWLAVGDGELRGELRSRVEQLGIADRVVWVGRRDDIDDLLAAMDIWVMSSIREGLPVALLEAMACGKTIVATRVGGIPDAVREGIEALLVPPGDAAALEGAVWRLLADPSLAAALGLAARERAVANYSIVAVARRIEDLYREELLKALGGARIGL